VVRHDRAAVRLDDDPAVALRSERPRADAAVEVGTGRLGQRHEAREPLARVEQSAALDGQAGREGVGPDLGTQVLAANHARLDAHEREAVARVVEVGHVAVPVGELEVAVLAEVRVDAVARDRVADVLIALERLAEQRAAALLAVAPDQLARPPLVARMDDPAVPRARAPAQLVRLDERHLRPLLGEAPRGRDTRVAATDDNDVRRVRQRLVRSVGHRRHRRVPVRPALVVAVQTRSVHRGAA
jgi:hypothetical protein